MLIEAEVQAGIVVDARGAAIGLVTAEMIFEWSRDSRPTEAGSSR